jgi:cellulose synthase/poly-beta-1,6-N-acetylglucosamine synthase-like glycosyltransferase
MTVFLQAGLLLLLLFLSIPVLVFVIQVFSAKPCAVETKNQPQTDDGSFSWVVLIPAHNEEQVIANTLNPLLFGVGALGGRILVVADNCSDGTVQLCRQMGAEVVERISPNERGKGYALQFGLDHLATCPPDVVVVLDADCTVSAHGIAELAFACFQSGLPTQSAYLMHAKEGASVSAKVSEFAWLVKTFVRPLGWGRLLGQCQLLGSGMAFPWPVISRFDLASGHLVEDLRLTADLAKSGVRVRFHPEVRVDSFFPTSTTSRSAQSRRWEHGHLGMIVSEVPALLANALRTRNANSLALALDMLVPPLSLLVLLVFLMAALEWVLALFSSDAIWFAEWATFLLLLLGGAVVRAWSHWGRGVLTPAELLQIPRFVLTKLGIYGRFVVKREKDWNRSDRD